MTRYSNWMRTFAFALSFSACGADDERVTVVESVDAACVPDAGACPTSTTTFDCPSWYTPREHDLREVCVALSGSE